ncbi:MAG: hypothetical protein ACP5JK_03095, partial [Candidatus Aenigmatarchaeota archaeon]
GGEKQGLLGPFGPACAGIFPFGKPSLVKPRKANFPYGSLRRLIPYGGLRGYLSLREAFNGKAIEGKFSLREPRNPLLSWVWQDKINLGRCKMKKRVVIEVEEEEYLKLSALKRLLNIEWKDLLIGGAILYYRELNLEEELRKIKSLLVDKINNTEEV